MNKLLLSLAPCASITLISSFALAQSAAPAAASPPPPPPPAAAPAETVPPPAETVPPPAEAAGPLKTMNNSISGLAGVDYGYGFGFAVGVRYQIAIVPNGFIKKWKPPKHDELALEFGVDFGHGNYGYFLADRSYNELKPVVGVLWNVWLSEDFAVYPKIELGTRIRFYGDNDYYASDTTIYIYHNFAAGLVYRLGDVGLRAELGYASLKGGVSFTF